MNNYFKKAAEKIYCDAKKDGRLIEGKTLDLERKRKLLLCRQWNV